MPNLSRRSLLAGAAATGVLAASATRAQGDPLSSTPDLTGKSILITGCSSGFGRIGAEYYARLGAKVFATMRGLPRPEAAELTKLARDENLDIEVIELDVLDDALCVRHWLCFRVKGNPMLLPPPNIKEEKERASRARASAFRRLRSSFAESFARNSSCASSSCCSRWRRASSSDDARFARASSS